MQKLPQVITTSVIRSTQQGESHGGVYLVNLESGDFEQVIDWNDPAISWEGRGGDRGLRGIAFYGNEVYIAASDEVFVYNRDFELLESHRNNYLKHCHEICIAADTLYLTSTAVNSVLEFDLVTKRFTCGYAIVYRSRKGLFRRLTTTFRGGTRCVVFDPHDAKALPIELARSDLHLNSVSRDAGAILVAGTRIEALLALEGGMMREYAVLPIGTHNATTYKSGIIYNDTRSNRVVIANRKNRIEKSFLIPEYADLPKSSSDMDYARQQFGRGLCTFANRFIIAGSSPSTISVYDTVSGERVRMVTISKDIRNCIHGLELWPDTECVECS